MAAPTAFAEAACSSRAGEKALTRGAADDLGPISLDRNF